MSNGLKILEQVNFCFYNLSVIFHITHLCFLTGGFRFEAYMAILFSVYSVVVQQNLWTDMPPFANWKAISAFSSLSGMC